MKQNVGIMGQKEDEDRLLEAMEELPDVLTVRVLAELVGVSRTTALRWLRTSELPGFQIGRKWFVLRDDVKDHIAAQRKS